ncbi:MAG TPA: hypothetical protein VK550_07230 [Polyangiaceae bacterium]|nr:hypothetical protein [Polyangiaceae bacterium]
METHSSLLLHRNYARSIVGLLLALSACSGDDSSAPIDGATNPPSDVRIETSGEHPDGAVPDGNGTDAPPSVSDAAPRDTSVVARDAAAPDAPVTPPPVDGRSDAALDALPDASTVDGVADTGGRADTSTTDAGNTDVTSDAPGPTNDAATACSLCASYGPAQQAGQITSAALNALSGIGASKRNAGVVYVHNDRNVAQFFGVSEAGALLGTFNLTGASVEDIEDMAVAHCPAGNCVYLADIGGNITPRTQFAVVRVPEPEVRVDMPGGTTSIAAERLVFSYADNANHNAESMLVDPNSDTIYIITKVAAGMPSSVYKLPATFGGSALTAEMVVDLTVPKSTDREAVSASAHPCAPAFLLRTYNTLYEFRAAPGSTLEAAFSATPTVVPVATETQGEGVTYRADGHGYFTTTEGSQPPISRVMCP